LGLLEEIEACVNDYVVFVAENTGDLACDPLLEEVNVHFGRVDFLIEFGWELGRFEALLINAHSHGCGAPERYELVSVVTLEVV
jgi:hypothetical protein